MLISISSCSSNTNHNGLELTGKIISFDIISSPKIRELSNIKNVAIIPFEKDKDKEISSLFESVFLKASYKNSPIYSVIDRSQIEALLKEHAFTMSIIGGKYC